MDSIYAIGAGLGLRFVVDAVTRHDFKITGTLVGLWEGVILLHFMKKMPRSSDPFVAFAVRLFIDFIITESISRFVLVVIWTGMGMVLADITPAVWEDAGMRRTWRHFRRDLYTISEMIPTVAFYPPTRTVRFSPSRELSVIEPLDADADANAHVEPPSDASSSVDMTEHPTLTDIVPPISNLDELIRRRVPGYFPGAFSDTDSVPSSIVGHRRLPSTLPHDQTRTVLRRSVYPSGDFDFNSDVDEANVSSNNSSTPTPTISHNADISAITEIPDEEELPMSSTQMAEPEETAAVKDEVHATPKQLFPPILPPTPSDSQPPFKRHFWDEDSFRQRSGSIPLIPDLAEDTTTSGRQKFQKKDAERAPTPPEKDWPKKKTTQKESSTSTTAPSALGVTFDFQQLSDKPIDNSTTEINETTIINETTNALERRRSQPPPYSVLQAHNDADDIYVEPEDTKASSAAVGDPLADLAQITEEMEQMDAVEAERIRKEVEVEEERMREEAKEEKRRKEAEEKEASMRKEEKKRKDAEEEKRRKEEKKKVDKEERERKEAEDAANREKKRAEDEAERLRKLAEATKAEEAAQKKKEEEAVQKEEEAVQKEEEEAVQKKKDEEAAWKQKDEEAAQKQKDEEAAQEQKDEEAAQKQKDEETAQKQKDEEAAQKQKDEEATQKQKDEEAAQKKDEEAVQKKAEEAAQKEKDEEAAQKREDEKAEKKKDEEVAQKVKDEEAAQKKIVEEAAAQMTEEEHQGVQANLAAQTITSPPALEREEQRAQETEKEVARGTDEEVLQEEEHQTAQVDAPPQTTADSSAGLGKNDGNGQRTPTPSNIPDSESDFTFSRQNPDVGLHGEEEQTADQRMETDSVTSELSERGEVGDRLERVLLLKAQIVEVQKNIEEFEERMKGADEEGKAQIERVLHPIQKALRKMKKREQRRWEAGSLFLIVCSIVHFANHDSRCCA